MCARVQNHQAETSILAMVFKMSCVTRRQAADMAVRGLYAAVLIAVPPGQSVGGADKGSGQRGVLIIVRKVVGCPNSDCRQHAGS